MKKFLIALLLLITGTCAFASTIIVFAPKKVDNSSNGYGEIIYERIVYRNMTHSTVSIKPNTWFIGDGGILYVYDVNGVRHVYNCQFRIEGDNYEL